MAFNKNHDIFRRIFCFSGALLMWLGFVVVLGPVAAMDWAAAWLNRKIDYLLRG